MANREEKARAFKEALRKYTQRMKKSRAWNKRWTAPRNAAREGCRA
jgi:hypothetical protein